MKTLIFKATRKDFRIDTFKSGGSGGQHQNKTDSGVRITHIPTGISAQCRDTRSQSTNKSRAFRRLAKILANRADSITKRTHDTSDEVVRTYHEPADRVVDHASNERDSFTNVVVRARPERVIAARALSPESNKRSGRTKYSGN